MLPTLDAKISIVLAISTSPNADPQKMSRPIDGTGGSPASAADRGFFGHPRGLSTLFFTEMWERFSYYGMRALLPLYMTKTLAEGGLAFDEKYASVIYATYVSSVWYLPLIGGDRKSVV